MGFAHPRCRQTPDFQSWVASWPPACCACANSPVLYLPRAEIVHSQSCPPGASVVPGQRPGMEDNDAQTGRSEEHTSELQSLMSNSYAVFCLKKKKPNEQ